MAARDVVWGIGVVPGTWGNDGDWRQMEKALVLVLFLISLHMILLLENCTVNTNLAAPTRDGGHQVPSGLVCIAKSS